MRVEYNTLSLSLSFVIVDNNVCFCACDHNHFPPPPRISNCFDILPFIVLVNYGANESV